MIDTTPCLTQAVCRQGCGLLNRCAAGTLATTGNAIIYACCGTEQMANCRWYIMTCALPLCWTSSLHCARVSAIIMNFLFGIKQSPSSTPVRASAYLEIGPTPKARAWMEIVVAIADIKLTTLPFPFYHHPLVPRRQQQSICSTYGPSQSSSSQLRALSWPRLSPSTPGQSSITMP